MACRRRRDQLTVHLLLDEMLPASLAETLRARGLDASGIDERPEARGSSDATVLALAAREGRVVVTLDCADFLRLDRHVHASGESHNGMILVNSRRYRQSKAGEREIADAIEALVRSDRSLAGHVSWLS